MATASYEDTNTQQILNKKLDFMEKYQRHVQFNYESQVPRHKTVNDSKLIMKDLEKELRRRYDLQEKQPLETKKEEKVNRKRRLEVMVLREEDKKIFEMKKETYESAKEFDLYQKKSTLNSLMEDTAPVGRIVHEALKEKIVLGALGSTIKKAMLKKQDDQLFKRGSILNMERMVTL
mmetsp:Transcript_2860/g.2687  ORF Transcript_2860/g.2687 Transcript_2860/m.2687 type:complete len:177 (-) Transcript_2860:27-557(-)